MHKILLLGTNNAVIDDFFRQLGDSFEILSSSLRYEDVIAHIKYVNPDAIVYCLKNETRDDMNRTVAIKNKTKDNIPFIIIGSEADCHDFNHCAINISDCTLIKPLTAQKIKNTLTDLLNKKTLTEKQKEAVQNTPQKEEPIETTEDMDLNSLLKSIEELTDSIAASRKHILIVDDDVQMLKTIKRHLEDKYDTATAINGNLALRFLQKKHTDLILLDYEMPEMKGPEILEQIRSNPSTQNIPVLFLTGIAEKEKIQLALSLNPQGYLLKPTDRQTLHAKISAILGQ